MKTNKDNLPPGISPKMEPQSDNLILQKGDVLFLLTNGIPEQTNEYGEKRFQNIVKEYDGASLKSMKDELFARLYLLFRGLQPQNDDMTLLALRFHG